MEPVELSTQPTRTDWTDRELAGILGCLIGGLATTADDIEALRRALLWWATDEGAWKMLVGFRRGTAGLRGIPG